MFQTCYVTSKIRMPFQFWSQAIKLKLQSSKQQHKLLSVKLTNSVRTIVNGLVKLQ